MTNEPHPFAGADTRPVNCRERSREEGRPYPRSSCPACGASISTGLKCRHALSAPTPPADVAGLARHTEAACKCEFGDMNVSATLRALSARVAALEGALQRTEANRDALAADNDELQAQLADARDKAQSALARLDASLFTNAEHQQAKDILRAMKGKP